MGLNGRRVCENHRGQIFSGIARWGYMRSNRVSIFNYLSCFITIYQHLRRVTPVVQQSVMEFYTVSRLGDLAVVNLVFQVFTREFLCLLIGYLLQYNEAHSYTHDFTACLTVYLCLLYSC